MAHQANQTGRPDGDRRGIRSRAAAAGRLVFPRKSDLLALIPATLAALAAIAAVLPPRSGLPSMALVFEPHLFIASAVLLAPLAVWGRARTLAAAIAVVMIAGGCLFGSEWISLPGSGAARHDISVMTWNVQYGTRTPADQAAQLENVTADLVALMEVEQDASDAIAADSILTSRFPYRALAPRPGAWGLAILSRYPISGLVSTGPTTICSVKYRFFSG